MSQVPISKLVTYESADGKMTQERISAGVWKVELLIAYGNEIDSVKRDLAESLRKGKEHPINPIVRWQKVVQSEPVTVMIEN